MLGLAVLSAAVFGFLVKNRSPDPSQALAAGLTYRSCEAARLARATPLVKGRPGYSIHLDGDRDGVACE